MVVQTTARLTQGEELCLPGGLIEKGARLREFAFRSVTGQLELALAEAVEEAVSFPAAVTEVLCRALASLGGRPASQQRVRNLCVSDRQFLLRRLQIHLGDGANWYSSECAICRACFDFHLSLAELPVGEAGSTYPFVFLRNRERRLRLCLPTGGDQEAIAAIDDESESRWELLRRCWATGRRSAGEGDWEGIRTSGAEIIDLAEAAMESVAPALVLTIQSACPDCGAENQVEIGPPRLLSQGADDLLGEIHRLASHYHWGEAEILQMPRRRRQRYLRLLDEARGMVH